MPRERPAPNRRDVPAVNNLSLMKVLLVACLCIAPFVTAEVQRQQQQQRVTIHHQRESPAELDGNKIALETPVNTDRKRKSTSSVDNHNNIPISKIDVSAIAALAPADAKSAVAAPPSRRPSSVPAGLTSPQFARSLEDWEVEDFVLLATVDGKLHARDRKTGRQLWDPIESETPVVETTHFKRSRNRSETYEESYQPATIDDYIWAIEPSRDGSLYVVRDGHGLTSTGLTMKTLVDKTPYSDSELGVTYAGKKDTTMFEIDAGTGEIKTWISAGGSMQSPATCSNTNSFAGVEDDECKSNPTFKLGRTEYTVGISGGKDNHPIAQLKFNEWVINNRDVDLLEEYTSTRDNKYIRTSHNGELIGVEEEQGYAGKMQFKQKLDSPITRVFDVMRPWAADKEDHLVVLPQPIPPQSRDQDGAARRAGRIFLNHTASELPEERSWYALSGNNYPGAVENPSSAPYEEHRKSWSKLESELGNDQFLETLVGLHSIESGRTLKLDGAPMLLDGPEHEEKIPATIPAQPEVPTLWQSSQQFWQVLQAPISNRDYLFFTILGLVLIGFFYNTQVSKGRGRNSAPMLPVEGVSMEAQKNAEDNVTAEQVHDVTIEEQLPQEKAADTVTVPTVSQPVPGLDSYGTDPETIIEEDSLQVPSTASPTKPASLDGDSQDKGPRKRGKRGGKKHKKGDKVGARDRSASHDGDSHDPKPAATVDDAVKKAQKLGDRQANLYPDLQSEPHDPQTIDDPALRVGGGQLVVYTDKLIGTGSNGTLVFAGKMGSRPVAVKRMQLQFFDIASQETKLLEESDGHENVIRYFTQLQADGFLYIALELCPASLADVIDKPHLPVHHELIKSGMVDLPNVLYQITNGVQYLHKLRIVHRDLKPQNILVNIKDGKPRLLVSDFGLCKKLEGEQSSFRATTAHAAGTSGWRAPELLLDDDSKEGHRWTMIDASTNGDSSGPLVSPDLMPNRRATRAIDIFSLGLVFFYVLTGGSHPFDCGDRYMREANIRKGKFSLEKLEVLGDYAIEADNIISRMLAQDPRQRPSALNIMSDPFFWSAKKRLSFLCDVSDHFEKECRDPPSASLRLLESKASEVIEKDFTEVVGPRLMRDMGKQRKYTGTKLLDLLRALRNKKNHYEDMSPELKKHVGALPDGYLSFWTTRFPNLLLTCRNVVVENGWDEEDRFRDYFSPANL